MNPAAHFHSLRHSWATWLTQAGASLFEVQRLLGHAQPSTTQIYSHLAASELHPTVGRLPHVLEPVTTRINLGTMPPIHLN